MIRLSKAWARKLGLSGPRKPRTPKGLKTVIPEPPIELVPDGTLICKFVMQNARAVPWKAPTVTRYGGSYSDPKVVAWQEQVAMAARIAYGAGRVPYGGPVTLITQVIVIDKGNAPDLTNIEKAIEDAIEEVIFRNDTQVCRKVGFRLFGPFDQVQVQVIAASDLFRGADRQSGQMT
jgi:hypothetical protein